MQTLRSPWWLAFAWVTSACALLLGLAMALNGEDVAAGLLGTAISAPASFALVRIPFIRVQASAAGVTIHGLMRKKVYSAEVIEHVSLGEFDDRVVVAAYAPFIRLVGSSDDIPIVQLAGYSTSGRVSKSRVGRQSALLGELLRPTGRVGDNEENPR